MMTIEYKYWLPFWGQYWKILVFEDPSRAAEGDIKDLENYYI